MEREKTFSFPPRLSACKCVLRNLYCSLFNSHTDSPYRHRDKSAETVSIYPPSHLGGYLDSYVIYRYVSAWVRCQPYICQERRRPLRRLPIPQLPSIMASIHLRDCSGAETINFGHTYVAEGNSFEVSHHHSLYSTNGNGNGIGQCSIEQTQLCMKEGR